MKLIFSLRSAMLLLLTPLLGCASSHHAPRQSTPSTLPPTATSAPISPVPTTLPFGTLSNDGQYYVSYKPSPDPIPHNEPFSLQVAVALAGSTLQPVPAETVLTVDARMPAHQHGMNRNPAVRTEGSGQYAVSGMLFHMSGQWELYFDVTNAGITERAQFTVELE